MRNLSYKTEPWDVNLQVGTVKGKSAQGYLLMTEYGLVQSRRAAGCLLEPDLGDQVLAVFTTPDSAHILSVLERGDQERTANVSVPGPAAFRVEGDLNLIADRLSMTGAKDMILNTWNLDLNMVQGKARFGEFRIKGGLLDAQLERVKTAVRYIDTFAERIIQKVKRSYRRVEEFEESKIGRVLCLVDDLFFIRSKNTTIKAQKRVKVDGQKIQLG